MVGAGNIAGFNNPGASAAAVAALEARVAANETDIDLSEADINILQQDDALHQATLDQVQADLFYKITKPVSTENHIPVYDNASGELKDSSASIVGYNMFVEGDLHLGKGIYDRNNNLVLHPTGKYINVTDTTNAHYGYIAFSTANDRGGYIGYGNADDLLDLYLDKANTLRIRSGDVLLDGTHSLTVPYRKGEGKVFASDVDGKGHWRYPGKLDDSQTARFSRMTLIEHFHSSSANDYIHIRTPLVKTQSRMFHYQVRGYAYGLAAIMDIVYTGYMYATTGSLQNKENLSRSAKFTDIDSYVGSDDHVYLRIGLSNDYYVSFTLESLVVGNGAITSPSDYSVIRSDDLTL